jgi:hypothetical protein
MISAEEKVFSIQDLRYIILSFYLDKFKNKRNKRKSFFNKIKEIIYDKLDICIFYIVLKIYRNFY